MDNTVHWAAICLRLSHYGYSSEKIAELEKASASLDGEGRRVLFNWLVLDKASQLPGASEVGLLVHDLKAMKDKLPCDYPEVAAVLLRLKQ